MTREEAINGWVIPAIKNTWNDKKCGEIIEALKLIPDNATNGDVIKALFPKAKAYNEDTSCATMKMYMGDHDEYVDFYKDWWDAPYGGGKV